MEDEFNAAVASTRNTLRVLGEIMPDEINALVASTWHVLRVLSYGKDKYPPSHFRTVTVLRHAEAAERHLRAWLSGQRLDADSGLPSLWHAMTRLVLASALEEWQSKAEGQTGESA